MSLDNMLKKLSVRSPWLFRINAGSCNGCDVELATTACTKILQAVALSIPGNP